MVKKFMSMLIIIAISFVTFFGFSSSASAESFKFKTGDGQWDGQIYVNNGGHVGIQINDWSNQDDLKVRLCSASSGNCTVFKRIRYGNPGNTTTFTNMVGGLYYADVAKLDRPNIQVTGVLRLYLLG
ncbi:hypothetical protein [Oceanobacillus kimchii]|uniref:hypothetical protein n=1 Tax=Oceanobacillus kimchii TaxID=746691 RepID=UPI00232CE46F|nr:hypothetical protein [Oceanobacillus kimchii]